MNPGGIVPISHPGLAPATVAPAVAGNDKNADPLIRRAAAKTGATARSGNGENGEPRSKQAVNSEYTPEEKAELTELRARDREVRAHELAHLAAAGAHARGGASFTFKPGPDGRRYAVAGEVSIDSSEVPGDPKATLAKAKQVRRAALAPADPSAQDRRVATQASAMAAKASAELAQQRRESVSQVEHAYAPQVDSDSRLIEIIV